MSDEATYRKFIGGLNLRYFSVDEIVNLLHRVKRGASNGIPPESLWAGQVPVLFMADEMRHFFGVPGSIHSVYRNEAYNRACGGASSSMHLKGRAVDISFRGVSPARVSAAFRKWRAAGISCNGIGTYRTFTHFDNRTSPANW